MEFFDIEDQFLFAHLGSSFRELSATPGVGIVTKVQSSALPIAPAAWDRVEIIVQPEISSPTGIELKGSPVERFSDNVVGMEKRQFGRTECGVRRLAALQTVVEMAHQSGRGSVVYIPKRANHVVRSGANKGPRKAHQSFARIGLGACAFA